jgi:DNA-binding MarR family transcriptional regulator
VHDEVRHRDLLQVAGEISLRKGHDAVVVRFGPTHHALTQPVFDDRLRRLGAWTVEAEKDASGRSRENWLDSLQALAMLSNSPAWTIRMSSLAEVTNASLSRLSHVVKRLESRGLVYRQPDPVDGRFTNAILTDDGFREIDDAAPGHVAHVRSIVIDVLTREQLRLMGRAAERVMAHIDTSAIN